MVTFEPSVACVQPGFRMSLSTQDVKKIAHLARLEASEAEVAATHASLTRILGLIEQMNAVDTKSVAPMAHPQDAHLRLREDRVSEPDQRDKFQQVAPATEAGLYLVPKVIE
jgi:aspartyl-tRNA(Asn)/glutamyl-tRNA(Gln) amidotransferase subunit C